MEDKMRILPVTTGLTLAFLTSGAAAAQQASQLSAVGDWKLTAIYDKFEDGHLRNTWGDKPQGLLQLSAGGLISLQVMGGNRPPKSETVPTEPVGPVRCSYGTYVLDISGKTLKFVVQQDSYPQFIGVTRTLKVEELTPTTLKFSVAPIHDPKGGDFTPHLEFARIQ
ncbi:lipocalin-like domain-containing protein [Bradyrhizobium sp. CCBAU 53421]|uniref:lipocalin-like domain-containing protein n=1 Tax=Bradyrhizobium sp. CCBAU 53421 TaxID=1325120 RepID=UPI00188C486F|nr:lipocalin-like domain-containing protein [Bradyrhizobium sp. CCBAU 53421]